MPWRVLLKKIDRAPFRRLAFTPGQRGYELISRGHNDMALPHLGPNKVWRAFLLLCLVLAPVALGGATGLASDHHNRSGPVPTPTWINLYGMESLLNGKPLPPGTVIEAFDPQGVLCGRVVVERPGQYGLMPVYGDDLSTPQDEGALPGDIIELRVNSLPVITHPMRVVWSSLGDLFRVEIMASSGGSYPVLQ